MDEETLANNGQFDEIYERLIDLRIACPEAGYPYSEALYADAAEYERVTGKKVWEDIEL